MINLNNAKYLLVVFLVSVIAAGCDDYLDVNTDPNNSTSAPIEGLLINSTLETARNTQRAGGTTSYFVQHFASPNTANETDTHQMVSYDNTWERLYHNLKDLSVLVEQADGLNAPHYSGIAKIMSAYNLGLLVTMFGDVPYAEALDPGILQPSYDSSEEIYSEMFNLLNNGMSDLQAGESTVVPGEDDFIFGGDLEAWMRTAYALQARYLNHYSKLGSYDPAAVLNALDNAITSNDEDFEMNFFDEGNTTTQNPWYRAAVNNAGLLLQAWLSDQTIDQLNGTTFGVVDPRIERITAPVSDESDPRFGEYIGTRNGAGRGADPEQGIRAVLAVGSYYASGPTAALEMATYAELKFIEAEAALKSGDTGRAYAAYEEGIRVHMEKLGVETSEIDAYWNDSSVSVGAGNLTISEIMKEKYIATFLNPETWNDARRFDYQYEGFQAPANSALGGEMIRLVSYPNTETQRNSANVPPRTMLDRIFWDQ